MSVESLKIVKIESGSLLSKIFGDDKILEVIGIIFRRLADYVHYTFTKKGKLELNSEIMNAISTDADIIQKLEDSGIDVKNAKGNIKDALNSATNELYNIVSKAPKMKINDEEMDIVDSTTYLEYRTKFLSTSNDEENPSKN